MNWIIKGTTFKALTPVVILAMLVSGCGLAPAAQAGFELASSNVTRQQDPQVGNDQLQNLVQGNTDFALDLYQAFREGNRNLFYSPYSISLALAMTYAGARGETEAQMAETLRFNLPQEVLHPAFNAIDQRLFSLGEGSEEDVYSLNMANSLWGQKGYAFLPEFLDLLAGNYGAGMRLVDFGHPQAARRIINGWIDEQTDGMIQDLISSDQLHPNTRLVLANTIYFNALWEYPFIMTPTQEGPFTLLDGTQVSAPMMSHIWTFSYTEGEDFRAIELPYREIPASMVVLLPDTERFHEFEASLEAGRLEEILADLQPEDVSLSMPKFEYEKRTQLADTLIQMGMPLAFDQEKSDFSGMDSQGGLFIGSVIHQAFVSVDERGTEAAASTTVMMPVSSAPNPEVEMTIDHPFIFLIRDRDSGAILFLGRVMNPTG
jgi:serpin B